MLDLGLREWWAICQGLSQGAICAVARKGGIHEHRGGLFRLQHRRFALIPALEHQAPERLLPALRAHHPIPIPPPGQLLLSAWAEVRAHWLLRRREEVDQLAALPGIQGLSQQELHSRFTYRGEEWLSLVLLQASVWRQPPPLGDHPAYGGCRSWIPLQAPLPIADSAPVLPAQQLEQAQRTLSQHFGDSQDMPE